MLFAAKTISKIAFIISFIIHFSCYFVISFVESVKVHCTSIMDIKKKRKNRKNICIVLGIYVWKFKKSITQIIKKSRVEEWFHETIQFSLSLDVNFEFHFFVVDFSKGKEGRLKRYKKFRVQFFCYVKLFLWSWFLYAQIEIV